MSVDSVILAASIGFNNEVSGAEQLASLLPNHLILKKIPEKRKIPTPCSMFGD